ncbi:MAG TPA: hypothetical protein IAA34_04425 [Candidatus Enterococcus stercoripullorum]|nr:hypothetical protein [Candidatus Enterococcus stercoripullorum]
MARKINVKGLKEILSFFFELSKLIVAIGIVIPFILFSLPLTDYKTDNYKYNEEKCEIYSTKNELYLIYVPNQKSVVDSTGKVDVDNVNVTKFLLYTNSESNVYRQATVKIRQTKGHKVRVEEKRPSNWFRTAEYATKINVYLPKKLYNQAIKDLEKRQNKNIKEAITG